MVDLVVVGVVVLCFIFGWVYGSVNCCYVLISVWVVCLMFFFVVG